MRSAQAVVGPQNISFNANAVVIEKSLLKKDGQVESDRENKCLKRSSQPCQKNHQPKSQCRDYLYYNVQLRRPFPTLFFYTSLKERTELVK